MHWIFSTKLKEYSINNLSGDTVKYVIAQHINYKCMCSKNRCHYLIIVISSNEIIWKLLFFVEKFKEVCKIKM